LSHVIHALHDTATDETIDEMKWRIVNRILNAVNAVIKGVWQDDNPG
jgi:hypothetical protein